MTPPGTCPLRLFHGLSVLLLPRSVTAPDGRASARVRGYSRRMNSVRVRAWIGTIVFLALAPGVVAGLVPWLITGWQVSWPAGWVWPIVIVAGIVIIAGVTVLLDAFIRFARADGTPAPPVPTAHLVVVGPYRYVRNPMYESVLAIVLGQALLFASWATVLYGSILFIAVVLFVRYYEQPTLEREYGEEYREYRRNVRGWVPRMRPWDGAD